jgi:hypothetical protein
MPVFSAMEVTAVERNPRFEPGAAVKARPVKALDLARRVAALEVRATSLVACMAMADMVRGQTTGAKAASQWCELTGGDRLGTHIWIKCSDVTCPLAAPTRRSVSSFLCG